jgi:hypothetical protein
MAELLELNLRAKKAAVATPHHTPPTPQAAAEGLVLEVGKKYLSNENVLVNLHAPQDKYSHTGWLASSYGDDDAQSEFYWEISGRYVGYEKDYHRAIRREWTPTWELEEAWMRGEKLEYFESMDGVWRLWNPYSYTLIQNTFGNSITTKEFWAKSYASQCIREDGTFRVRIKPVA